MRRWEDREKRLEVARLKEKALEDRVRKRRRIEEHASSHRTVDDEDAEWLLNDPDDRAADSQDPLSGLSKESRDILTKIGLGGWKGPGATEEEELLEENIKVRIPVVSRCKTRVVTLIDLLYLKNPFPIIPIYHGASPPCVSVVVTKVHGSGKRVEVRTCQTAPSFLAAKALY